MDFLDAFIDDKTYTQIKDDVKIARYMSEDKFIKSLYNKNLWFANTKQFHDNHERTLDAYDYEGRNKEIVRKISEKTVSKCEAYVSCWTNFENGENAALWKIFDANSDGVCIISTVGQMKEQLHKELCHKAIVEEVGYGIKGEAPIINLDKVAGNYWAIEFLKICPYFFEREIRAVIYSKNDVKGYAVDFDWKKITNKIIISPFAKDEQAQKLKEIVNRHFGIEALLKSELDESKKD